MQIVNFSENSLNNQQVDATELPPFLHVRNEEIGGSNSLTLTLIQFSSQNTFSEDKSTVRAPGPPGFPANAIRYFSVPTFGKCDSNLPFVHSRLQNPSTRDQVMNCAAKTHVAPAMPLSPEPPDRIVRASPESATEFPWRAAPLAPVPTSFSPHCSQLPAFR
ncbi:hypothetical protein LP7551_01454 [Roseibium album]|nr:hypothetical protein LP7551_01454 [Roseibium album]